MVKEREGRGWDFDISNKQGGGLGKIEIEVFPMKWGKSGIILSRLFLSWNQY